MLRTSGSNIYLLSRNTGALKFYCTNGTVNLDTGDFTPDTALGNWIIFIANINFDNTSNATLEVYVNSTTANDSATGTKTATPPSASYVNYTGDALYPNLDLAESIFYLTHLSTQNISDLMTYYGNKYNISIS